MMCVKKGRTLKCATGDQISVQGWAYLEGEKWNNYRKVSILFIDNSDQVIKINTTKMYRSDIGVLIPNKRMFMIGFQCLCSNTMLKKNEKYKIAIAIGKRLTYIN